MPDQLTSSVEPTNTPDEHEPEPEGQELCVSCLSPNEPGTIFCAKCGAPLSSIAAMAPFLNIHAEGFIYRNAAERPRSLVVVLGVWLLFICMGGAGAAMMFTAGSDLNPETVQFLLIGPFLFLASIVIIWRTTSNYLSRPPIADTDDSAPDAPPTS